MGFDNMVLWFFFIISLLTNVALVYATRNLLQKYEILEKSYKEMDEYFQYLHQNLTNVLSGIEVLDYRGAFAADDEVGFIFKAIKGMIQTLQKFININEFKSTEAS